VRLRAPEPNRELIPLRLTKSVFVSVVAAGVILYAANEGSGIDRSDFDSKCQPCEDFWRYANGGWIDRNPVPKRFSSWGTMSTMREANDERLRVLLEAARTSKAAAGTNERKIGDLYGGCMDEAGIEARGLKPVQPYLDRVAKMKTPKDLVALITWMQGETPVGPVALFAGQDRKNSGETIANVFVNATSLPERDYYMSTEERQKKMRAEYVAHVAKMFALMGDAPEAAQKQAEFVLAFETKFAEVALSRVQMRDPYATYHPMDLAGLAALTPAFDWKPVFRTLGVPEATKINVSRLESLKLLNEQLTATPIEDWKTWFRWRIVTNAAEYLPKKLADEDFRFAQGVLAGVKEQKPRWQVCAAMVDDKLGEALGQVFVEKHFPPAAKKRMLELVNNLKVTLGEELGAAEWLSPETRAQAVKKLEAFVPKIGYPDKWRDYSAVKVNAKQYFESVISANVAERRHNLAKIGKPLDKTEWGMTPPTVNAYYSPLRNEIAFPAGILQPPMFDMTAGDEINYGSIGAVIGHEMGHGFDDQGSKYDNEGNLKNWWTAEDRKRFDDRSACMVQQFDTMDVGNGQHHNGKLVLGEALGDLGGLTLSYRAWKRSLKGKPEPPVIDGFTAEQRFFLSFARTWKQHYTPEAVQLRLKTDPHPLAKFRANGTLMNMPEFHRAFQCKLGDKMVKPPAEQCKLW
jgi:putative endopeptidase